MAASAVGSKLPIVHIVTAVAVTTTGAKLRHGRQRLPVAVIATGFEMSARQEKIRFSIVIELPLQPVNGVVAGGAIFVKTPLVRVVLNMTFDARFRRIAKHVRLVA